MFLTKSCVLFEVKSPPVTGIKTAGGSDGAGGANVGTDVGLEVGFGDPGVAVGPPGVGVGSWGVGPGVSVTGSCGVAVGS